MITLKMLECHAVSSNSNYLTVDDHIKFRFIQLLYEFIIRSLNEFFAVEPSLRSVKVTLLLLGWSNFLFPNGMSPVQFLIIVGSPTPL